MVRPSRPRSTTTSRSEPGFGLWRWRFSGGCIVKWRGILVVAMAGLVSGCSVLTALQWASEPAAEPEGREAEADEREGREAEADQPAAIAATLRLVQVRRVLPAELEERAVDFVTSEPLVIERLAGRLADVLAVDVAIEERPARDGRGIRFARSEPIDVEVRGKVRDLLDAVARRSGYVWEYVAGESPPRIVLYRFQDEEWARSFAVREGPAPERDVWRMDPGRHETVRGVLEAWASDAGWTLVWEAEELDYAVTAKAAFRGSFEDAVDGLLRDTRGYRVLIPTAWRENRYLTIRAGG